MTEGLKSLGKTALSPHPIREADRRGLADGVASERRSVPLRLIRDEGRHDKIITRYE